MIHRLAEGTVFLMGCCGGNFPVAPNNDVNSMNALLPSNNVGVTRHWNNKMSKNAYHGAGIYSDVELAAAFAGISRWREPVLPHVCPKFHNIAGPPTARQAKRNAGPTPYSVDCNLLDNNSKNSTSAFSFIYTGTPQLHAELFLLKQLSVPPANNHYKSAQDDLEVIVLQVPCIDGLWPVDSEVPLLLQTIDLLYDVLIYDINRNHTKQKKIIFYGRIPSRGGEHQPEAYLKSWEKEAQALVFKSGFHYVPFLVTMADAVNHGGAKFETTWHFCDTGQHYITQVFVNVFEAATRCHDEHDLQHRVTNKETPNSGLAGT